MALEILDDHKDKNMAWQNINVNIKTSAKETLCPTLHKKINFMRN